MKKILVRAHMSPFDNLDAETVLREDHIGTNSGNMLFASSVIRTLMTEDVQVDTLHTGTDLTAEHLERINAEYDCVVMPFANAFRLSFQRKMEALTKFIRQLKIPCVVDGIGISSTLKGGMKEQNPYDDTAREFVKAVLEKSAVIGTRGEATSAYLSRLGFKEESEHRVIGCPSMFWYGDSLPELKQTHLTPQSSVSVNWKLDLPAEIHNFIKKNTAYFEDFQYVPQVIDELRLMYYGTPLPQGKYKRIPQGYPSSAAHPWYAKDRARGFINVPSWMEYLAEKDFSFGTRIHGNIAAILAGTPCFIVVSDYRILELAQYHHIPHINYKELKEGDDIFTLYEKADLSRIYQGHRERFEIYKTFLEENGLDHIYREGAYEGALCPYDRKMQEISAQPALTPFFAETPQEQARRLEEIQRVYMELQAKYDSVRPVEMLLKQYHLDGSVRWLLKKLRRG